MDKLILPAKVQIGDRVSLEIGTAEYIFSIVKAIKFTENDIFYDLGISTGEDEECLLRDIQAAYVSAIVASVYRPSPDGDSLLPILGDLTRPGQ